MPRSAKTQWDFGELFPPEATRRVWSVSELTSAVKRLLEKEIGSVWVSGEVTNLRLQSSGHVYFTLKDAGAQLSCVLFRGEPAVNREALGDGRKVLLQGELSVYEPRGQYQLIVRRMELQGVGALQLAFEQLKRKLQAEGLFAPERKRPLPRYPQRLGIATSPTGAALQDVVRIVQRRQPGLEIILAPCRVQGEGAAQEIATAIQRLNQWSASPGEIAGRPLDLILVTRGGGSLEDLWAFNEEVVARAIYESALPVVSAVGHEIDFTIGDFVADVRAATPSVAAELITEGAFASRQWVADTKARLRQLARRRLEAEREYGFDLAQRLARAHPRRRLNERQQHLDDLRTRLIRRLRSRWRDCLSAGQTLGHRLACLRPSLIVRQRRERFLRSEERLGDLARNRLKMVRHRWAQAEARLRLLGPTKVLERGYSITMDETTGRILRSAEGIRQGQRLKTRLGTGEIISVAETPLGSNPKEGSVDIIAGSIAGNQAYHE